MWARIEKGLVAEITDEDPIGRFHPSLEWVTCKAGIECGMSYSAGKFTEIPARSYEDLAASARHERDSRMRDVYDIGVMKINRDIRLAGSPEEIEPLQEKLAALDAYAVALLNVPQQTTFPNAIEWPTIP